MIIDYDSKSVCFFNFPGDLLKKVNFKIDFPENAKYNFLLDRVSNEGYFEYPESTGNRVKKIDLNTGMVKGNFFINNFRDMENLIISNGYAYFLYLDPNGNGNKRLFNLPLPKTQSTH